MSNMSIAQMGRLLQTTAYLTQISEMNWTIGVLTSYSGILLVKLLRVSTFTTMAEGYPEKSNNVRYSFADGTSELGERYRINIIVAESQDSSAAADIMADREEGVSGRSRRPPEDATLMSPVGAGGREEGGTREGKVHPVAGTSEKSKVIINPMTDQKKQWMSPRATPRRLDRGSREQLREIDYPLRTPHSPPRRAMLQGFPPKYGDPGSSLVTRPSCACAPSWSPNEPVPAATSSEECPANTENTVFCILVFVVFIVLFLAFLLTPRKD